MDKQILTLDEIYDIYTSPQYKILRYIHSLDDLVSKDDEDCFGNFVWNYYMDDGESMLCRHLIAEKLFSFYSNNPYPPKLICLQPMLLRLSYDWMHPLSWLETFGNEQLVIVGKVAKEIFDEDRKFTVMRLMDSFVEGGILGFADKLPLSDGDYKKIGQLKNVHVWEFITANTMKVVSMITREDINRQNILDGYKAFDSEALRYSITIIENKYGEQKAADILRLLQSEWNTIKTWKSITLKNLSQEEIQKFEQCLFKGFKLKIADKPFKYLTRKCYDENKVKQVEDDLKNAIDCSDPAIWDCLFRYMDLGYIETLDDIKTPDILRAIEERFGPINRSPRNFNIARNKAVFRRNN